MPAPDKHDVEITVNDVSYTVPKGKKFPSMTLCGSRSGPELTRLTAIEFLTIEVMEMPQAN